MDRKRILTIDDEVNFTKLLKLNLEQTGKYQVQTENRGAQGIVAAKAFKPDLILLDIVMPDMEGPDVAVQLKSDESVKDIPIVFLTAVVTKEEAGVQGETIGGHPFIAKTASLEDLIECIERNLSK